MLPGMPTGSDAGKDFWVVLSYLTGRKLTLEEVLAAVEMSRSTYYDRQAKGTLTNTDTLLTAARNLGLNPVDLLVRYGRLATSDVADYLEVSEDMRFAGGGTVTRLAAPVESRHAGRARITEIHPRADTAPL
jgi:hypothetical protein